MQEDRVGPENRVALGNLIFPFACENCSSTLMGSSPRVWKREKTRDIWDEQARDRFDRLHRSERFRIRDGNCELPIEWIPTERAIMNGHRGGILVYFLTQKGIRRSSRSRFNLSFFNRYVLENTTRNGRKGMYKIRKGGIF